MAQEDGQVLNHKNLTRSERRRLRTREDLLSAIRNLTAEHGVEGVTIRNIADEADIAVGGFYSYFDSKEALLNEAASEILFNMGEVIDAANAHLENPADVIATAFSTSNRLTSADPILGWFLVRITDHSSEWTASLMERLVRDVARGVDLGIFKVPDVALATDLVAACALTFARNRLTGRLGEDGVVHFAHLALRLLGVDDDVARETANRAWNVVNG